MSNVSRDTTTVQIDVVGITINLANRIKFWILLTLQLLSITCFLYIFYQYGRQPPLRQSEHRAIHLLLIVSFLFVTIALPLSEVFMHTSYVHPASDAFCSFWNWIHYSLNITNLFLMAFASIERNWLIFHPWLVRNKTGRILFHYCPLLFCLLYPSLFYMGVIFIYPCESFYDYTQLLCIWPCYFYNLQLAYFDLFFNNYTPLVAIPLFCVIIYVRVLIQKRVMKQEVFKWKRDKMMILQLWAISSLYLATWMPLELTGLINLYWDPSFLIQAQIDYMYLFPYFNHLLYPFIVLLTHRREMFQFRRNKVVPHLTNTLSKKIQNTHR